MNSHSAPNITGFRIKVWKAYLGEQPLMTQFIMERHLWRRFLFCPIRPFSFSSNGYIFDMKVQKDFHCLTALSPRPCTYPPNLPTPSPPLPVPTTSPEYRHCYHRRIKVCNQCMHSFFMTACIACHSIIYLVISWCILIHIQIFFISYWYQA